MAQRNEGTFIILRIHHSYKEKRKKKKKEREKGMKFPQVCFLD